MKNSNSFELLIAHDKKIGEAYKKLCMDLINNDFEQSKVSCKNILELIKTKKPRVVFLENVKNLASHDNGNTFKVILGSLEEVGYKVHHKILNGTTHGNVPQNRERIFIVAFRE